MKTLTNAQSKLLAEAGSFAKFHGPTKAFWIQGAEEEATAKQLARMGLFVYDDTFRMAKLTPSGRKRVTTIRRSR